MLTADVIELLTPDSNGKLLIITIGNKLRSDDGVAPYISEHTIRPKDGIMILNAGERPEDILWKAIDVRPDRIIIIDAADFGGEAGHVRVMPEDYIVEKTFSTHRFPLRIISTLVREDTGAEVDFLCIQPKSVEFGEYLTESVRTSAEQIINVLCEKN